MKMFGILVAMNSVAVVAAVVSSQLSFGGEVKIPRVHVVRPPDPLFPFGDMTSPKTVNAWKVEGGAKVGLDSAVFGSGPSGLRIDLPAGKVGKAICELIPVDKEVEIFGRIRRMGDVQGTLLVHLKDGLAPQVTLGESTVASLTPNVGEWSDFRFRVRFPVSYYGAQLLLKAQGPGSVWLDDIDVKRVKP